MFSRKNPDDSGQIFPDDLVAEFLGLLNQNFQKELALKGLKFHFYGETHKNELLMVLSVLDFENSETCIPTTIFVSSDMEKIRLTESRFQEDLHRLLDIVGNFLDMYFTQDNFNEYLDLWTEESIQGQNFFYKVTRENIALTIESNAWLINQ